MESEVVVNAYISVVNYWFSIKVFSQQQVFTYCYPEIMYNVSMDEEKVCFLYMHIIIYIKYIDIYRNVGVCTSKVQNI